MEVILAADVALLLPFLADQCNPEYPCLLEQRTVRSEERRRC
jgi:hypothetical protein